MRQLLIYFRTSNQIYNNDDSEDNHRDFKALFTSHTKRTDEMTQIKYVCNSRKKRGKSGWPNDAKTNGKT